MQDLFSEAGNVQNVRIHYDKAGRSLGEADVFFGTRAEVTRAISKYTHMALDGPHTHLGLAPPLVSLPFRFAAA